MFWLVPRECVQDACLDDSSALFGFEGAIHKKRGELVSEGVWTGARGKLVRRQGRRDLARDEGKTTERPGRFAA